MKTKTEQIKTIKSKLLSLHNKESVIEIAIGLNVVVVIVLVLNVLLSLLELSGLRSIIERTILFYFGIITAIISMTYFILLPILKSLNIFKTIEYKTLAIKVGQYYPEIKDKLKNVLELTEDKNKRYSKALTNAAIKDIYEKTINLDFNKTASFKKTKSFFVISAVAIIITVILFYFTPALRFAAHRIINHSNKFSKPPKLIFYISPGNTSITKNSDIIISAETVGEKPKAINFYIKSTDDPVFIEYKTFSDSNGFFTQRLNSLKKSTQYYAKSENIMSEVYVIKVIDKPIVSHLQLTITPPKYSKLNKIIQKDNGNIKTLVGSKVELTLKSNKKLLSGYLEFKDGLKKDLIISKSTAETLFYVNKNGEYKIAIYDSAKNKNKNPVTYTIASTADEHPSLEVVEPQQKTMLTKLENVASHIKISDDYGFSKLLLHHRLSASSFETPSKKYSSLEINLDKALKEQDVYSVWDVSSLLLTAGDVIAFYFEVFDNDNIAGPKATKSSLYTLYVPTIEELYRESEITQEEVFKEIEQTLKEAEKVKEELKKLSDELKIDKKEISWEEKKKIESANQKFENLKNKIEKTQKKTAKNQDKLEQNELLSKETLEKYFELQKLMDEMNSEEMKAAMQKLQQQLESMNRENVNKALDEMKFNEEMFRKSLERTMNLLKRIQIEQKMDEIVKRTEDIKESLDKLEEETKKSSLSDSVNKDNLAKKQDKIKEKISKLKEEMKKLQEKMSSIKDMPNKEMEEFQKEFDSQKNEELSDKAKEKILQQLKKDAQQQMQMLSQNMQKASNQMQSMQQQMQMQNQLQTMYDMMKATNNLIELSKQEEKLKKQTEQTGSSQLLKNAPTQNELLTGLEKTIGQLSELSQKTFAITPEMGKALGRAKAEMQQSIIAMQSQNSNRAMLGQSGAMKYLNEAATMMKGKMDQMMNGGQGGGMMSMMQQMQQLSQQQMNLNKLTQQLNKGSLSTQQQAQLQRLAEEQRLIRKSLGQLNKENKESGKSKKLTTNLDKILSEMEEVIAKMKTTKVNDELIQSQEKILSKLLDAQRSINERDFEEKRESKAGRIFSRESPDDINFEKEEDKNKIREELVKAIKEGYSHDYEELIRKYYEALEKTNEETPIIK